MFPKYVIVLVYSSLLCPLALAQVRLADGDNPSEGRVEVYHNGEWGAICNDDWDISNANVVCRMLGLGNALQATSVKQGSGTIWLDDVDCGGSESDIKDCYHSGYGNINCGSDEVAGVVCEESTDITTVSKPAPTTLSTPSETKALISTETTPSPTTSSKNSPTPSPTTPYPTTPSPTSPQPTNSPTTWNPAYPPTTSPPNSACPGCGTTSESTTSEPCNPVTHCEYRKQIEEYKEALRSWHQIVEDYNDDDKTSCP